MKTHQDIDQRSLTMARAIVARIDADPLTQAKDLCQRWYRERNAPAYREWLDILERPWTRGKNCYIPLASITRMDGSRGM